MASASPVDALENFQIDYEINNKKVRKYTIADVSTVRAAIAEHIYDFLDYHKVPSYHGYEYARWCFGVVIIAAGVFSYIYKHEEFLDNRPIYIISAIVFAICTAAQLYIAKFVEGSQTIFLSKPYPKGKGSSDLIVKAISARVPTKEEEETEIAAEEARVAAEKKAKEDKKSNGKKAVAVEETAPKPDESEAKKSAEEVSEAKEDTAAKPTGTNDKAPLAKPSKKEHHKEDKKDIPIEDYAKYATPTPTGSIYAKPLKDVLANRHARIRLEMCDSLPIFKLHAEELDGRGKRGFWASPKVLTRVTKDYAFASFFDKEGFVYPPAIKEETLRLLQALAQSGKQPKGNDPISPKDSKKRK